MKISLEDPVRTEKISLEDQVKIIKSLRTDPFHFPEHLLKLNTLWWGAERMIRSVFQNNRTAVQSGHSLSKDWIGGIVALQWLCTYYPSKVICTGPTGKHVKEIMFSEISKQYSRLKEVSPWPIVGELTSTKLSFGDDWYAIGMTSEESHTQSIGKFMGFKSPNMLVIVTEAQSVGDLIYDQFEGMTTSGNAHVLEIGNPIAPIGRFWEHCTQARYGYNVIKLSCFDSPNVVEGREVIPGMVTKEWIDARRREWGEDHPYWRSRVLGEFPQSAKDAIIPLGWIMRAVCGTDKTHLHPAEFLFEQDSNDCAKVGGLDVSKGGPDETVHLVLTGPKATKIDAFHDVEIPATVGWAKNLLLSERIDAYAVDEGGLAGVAAFLEEEQVPGVDIIKFLFNGKVEESSDFDNLGAQAWWELRTAFEKKEIFIPDDPVLISQLANRKYDYTSRGKRRIKLESKSDAKSRGIESPDRGDALAMAWHARLSLLSGGKEKQPVFENEASRANEELRLVSAPSGVSHVRESELESDMVRY